MDKQQLIEKATETLRPFETANLVDTVQNLTLRQISTHPLILIVVAALFFLGVVKRSRPVLFLLFSLLVVIILLRYAMPAPGEDLTAMDTLPFFGGAILVGGVILYYTFIKTE